MAESALSRYFPILSWLPTYSRRWLRADLIAGVIVTVLLIPEGMAYAEMAGLPPEAVFFVAPAALLGYALFGTSRQVIVAPTAPVAILSAAAVASLAADAPGRFLALTAALALLIGFLYLLSGIARLGFVSEFFSSSVATGFLFGLALLIVLEQVPKLMGLRGEHGEGVFQTVWDLATQLHHAQGWTLVVGATSLILLFVLHRISRRISHRFPTALTAIVYGIVLTAVLGLEARGVRVVGAVPDALPIPGLPSVRLADIASLIPVALGIMLIGYAESIGAARRFAHHHQDVDPNQELIALGVSNLGAGLFQGFAVGGSLSMSVDNDHAGARTQMSAIVAAVLVLLVALVVPSLLHNLPEATLAAVVVYGVWEFMDVQELGRLYRIHKLDFLVAAVALLGVLVLGALFGLLVAVGLSLLAFIYRASRPHFSVLGRAPGEQTFGSIERHPENQPVPGLIIIRLDAPLFFANAALLRDEIRRAVRASDPAPWAVLLDLEATSQLDVSGIDMLSELAAELRAHDVEFHLARVHGPVHDLLRRVGVVDEIGADRFHHMVRQGVEAFLEQYPPGD